MPLPHSTAEETFPSPGQDMEQLPLSQPSIFRSLSVVFENTAPQEDAGLGFDHWSELLKHDDSEFETDKIWQIVVSILQYLEVKFPITLVSATKILADGSRYGEYF